MKSWQGLKEGPAVDRAIINPWNAKTGCHATSKKNHWCAITVASCLLQVKASGYSMSATCKGQKEYFKKHKRWITAGTKPRRGDIIFVTGHEGMITCVRLNGTGAFISGNCSNAVRITEFNWKKCTYGKKKVLGYGRPIYK